MDGFITRDLKTGGLKKGGLKKGGIKKGGLKTGGGVNAVGFYDISRNSIKTLTDIFNKTSRLCKTAKTINL